MSVSTYYERKKSDPEWLERKRARDRKNQKSRRKRDPEASRNANAKWRAANKDKIADNNRRHWEITKADAEKLEKARRRNRVAEMSNEQQEKKRQKGREYSKKKTRAALVKGTTRYAETLTPEIRDRETKKMAKWRDENKERSKEIGRKATQRYRDKRGPRASIDNQAQKMIRAALIAADSKSKFFPGYTGAELKQHIINTIPNGWTIFDYGSKWEIDHIIPKSAFDYLDVDDEQYRMCWSLENLRACCKIENRRKGGVKGMY